MTKLEQCARAVGAVKMFDGDPVAENLTRDEIADIVKAVLSALLPPDAAMVEAGASRKWEGGYDRNSSHAADAYVAYEEGLSTLFGDNGDVLARIYAQEIFTAMIQSAMEVPRNSEGPSTTRIFSHEGN